jgi:hypothetical protein
MNSPPPAQLTAPKIVLWGMLAFALLTVRFSPNWAAFYDGAREAKLNIRSVEQNAAVDAAILSGYSARGYFVAKQAQHLSAEITDPNHKIVRWRLLIPALGHFLNLPAWLVLSLAHVGCVVFILSLFALCAAQRTLIERPRYETFCFCIVAGATAPFFTSMGLLGYYDAWLALGLLAVSFARRRWVVLAACLLTPWIDERFVIGLPLALCIRWIRSDGTMESQRQWFMSEAMVPLIVVAAYTVVRLSLGGSGSSQTVSDYLNEFVFGHQLSVVDYITGAWAGLRIGWLFVAAAIIGTWTRASTRLARAHAVFLSVGVTMTGLIGLVTALDLSRSMVLLLPVLPLGWVCATRTVWWSILRVAPLVAVLALVLPASHVVGRSIRPVDNVWSPPTPLTHFQNTLGVRYLEGDGVFGDSVEAVKWFRNAADQGLAEAQFNLGLMCIRGDGTELDGPAAVRWFRAAAGQGFAKAQHKLAVMYALGEIVTKDDAESSKWYRKAAEQGYAPAQSNLGAKYLAGIGVARDNSEAVKWFRKAAEQGYAPAQSNLAVMYFHGNGVEKDLVRANAWCQLAAARGFQDAKNNLAMIEQQMTPGQKAEAAELARSLPSRSP